MYYNSKILNEDFLKIDSLDNFSETNLLNFSTKTLRTPKELLEEKNQENFEIYKKVNLRKRNSLIVKTTVNDKSKNQITTLNLSNLEYSKKNCSSLNNSNSTNRSNNSKLFQILKGEKNMKQEVKYGKINNSTILENNQYMAMKKKSIKSKDFNHEFLDLIPFFNTMIGENFKSFEENNLLDCLNSQDKNMLIKGLIYCVLDLDKKVKLISPLENRCNFKNNYQ